MDIDDHGLESLMGDRVIQDDLFNLTAQRHPAIIAWLAIGCAAYTQAVHEDHKAGYYLQLTFKFVEISEGATKVSARSNHPSDLIGSHQTTIHLGLASAVFVTFHHNVDDPKMLDGILVEIIPLKHFTEALGVSLRPVLSRAA